MTRLSYITMIWIVILILFIWVSLFLSKIVFFSLINYHFFLVLDIRNYKCSFCDKAYVTNCDLKTHVDFKHLSKMPCQFEVFVSIFHNIFCIIISELQKFVCDICDKSFRLSADLRIHKQRRHLRESCLWKIYPYLVYMVWKFFSVVQCNNNFCSSDILSSPFEFNWFGYEDLKIHHHFWIFCSMTWLDYSVTLGR